MTKEDYRKYQLEVENIELAIAKGEDTPKLKDRLCHLDILMDDAPYTIDLDTGYVIDKVES